MTDSSGRPDSDHGEHPDDWQRLRVQMRRLERFDPGFGLQLDAWAMVDLAVLRTLHRRHPACGPGCCQCCTDQPIPAAPLEIRVLHAHMWLHRAGQAAALPHATPHVLPNAGPNALPDAAAGSTHEASAAHTVVCPFLGKDGCCTVYALRPIACRQFLVFGAPCQPHEDVFVARRQEVFTPDYEVMKRALLHTLPWYAAWPGFPGVHDPKAGVAFLQGLTVPLQTVHFGGQGGL